MKQEDIVIIMKTLVAKENRTEKQINTCVEDLEKLKAGDSVENYFIGCFISLCKYLKGYKLGIYEVPKEMRIWFLEEYKCS